VIFSPSVLFIHTDERDWTDPMDVDVGISPAVNMKTVCAWMGINRNGEENQNEVARRIEEVMRERMAKVLCLFRANGMNNLSLETGTFGCVLSFCTVFFAMMGVFGCKNNINTIAMIRADLLAVDGTPFKDVFTCTEIHMGDYRGLICTFLNPFLVLMKYDFDVNIAPASGPDLGLLCGSIGAIAEAILTATRPTAYRGGGLYSGLLGMYNAAQLKFLRLRN
jgi:hypothetical protein